MITDVQDMAWTIWLYRGEVRVLTGLVEDSELVAKLKLMAADMNLRVEIRDVTEHKKVEP